jgi:small nuclear ribonucleoprotein (snRNP)-like protein
MNMKGTAILLTLAALFAASTAGTISAQDRTMTLDGLKEFGAIEAAGKIELITTIDPAQSPSLSIEYNGNDQNKLKWWDDGGVLQLKFNSSTKDKPVVVHITCRSLSTLDLSGGASMTTTTTWVEKMVTIELSSNSKLTATIEAVDIQLSAQTGSVVIIEGIGTYAAWDVRTRSSLDAHKFESKSTTLRTNGYAECKVYGSERLVVDATDGAKVFWRGAPDILRLRSSRGANVYPIGK